MYDTQIVHCMRKRYSLRYFDSITTIQCRQRLIVDIYLHVLQVTAKSSECFDKSAARMRRLISYFADDVIS